MCAGKLLIVTISVVRFIFMHLDTVEALPGVPVHFPPEINCFVTLFPKNQNLDFLCSLFPKIAFVPQLPSCLFPLKQCPCSPKTPGRASLLDA